ncbi:hypothetical protein GQ457_17G004780 [Hibiscus cannabinus]
MNAEASFTALAPPIFDGTNYQGWVVRMEAYLDAIDVWEAVDQEYEIPPLPNNPTVAQIKNQKDRKQQKSKAKASLFAVISNSTFNRIMTKKTSKEIWDFLKKKSMKEMKESEAQEQRRRMRQGGTIEGALQAKSHSYNGEANATQNPQDDEQMFVASCFTTSSSTESWLIDSGCTNHMSYDRGIFKELHQTVVSRVKIGNGAYINVEGKGTVAIEGHIGLKFISDVLYVPEINQNLLSVAQLLEKGYKVLFEDKKCIIKDAKNKDVFNIHMKDKSFALDFMQEEQAAVHKEESHTMLWHRSSHQKLLTFFWKFKAYVETQSGCKMQVIRSDNGTEYTSEKFNKFCQDADIEHQLTAPYTPQQNGVVERKNRTIMDTVKIDKLDKKADAGIFVGYSSSSNAYRIYLPDQNKVIISRDVQFYESDNWSWEVDKKIEFQDEEDDIDDEPVRGTRLLSDIYQRCNVAMIEPTGYEEAASDKKWMDAMKEELNMIEKNQTWELVDRPNHKKAIGARLVVKGYAQMFGVDFSETFALVARMDTVRLLLALAAQKGWLVHQMDVKSAFLNGYLKEEIFIEQPQGFTVQGEEEKVYRLKKALYGLKQAPRSWYSRIDAYLLNLSFEKCLSESTLYIKKSDDEILVVSLYVDDLLVTGSSLQLIEKLKDEMKEVFEMKDLGEMTFFLGMQILVNSRDNQPAEPPFPSMREAETAVLMFEGAWTTNGERNTLRSQAFLSGENVDKENPVALETSSSESSASSDQVEKPASPGEKLFETNEALNDASLEIPSNNCANIQVEFAARSVEKSNLVGCRTKANLEGSRVGGFSNKGLGDGSTKSQCKEHGPKWVDVVKGGAARLPYSDPKEGIDLSNNDDVVNRDADEDPKNISPGGAVMAQEMLVDNLVVSIGSKEVEREELSGRISPVLEHRKMDHVTLELPEFQSITKPGRVKRYGSLQHLQYNSLSAAEKKKVDRIRKRNKKSLKSPVHSELEATRPDIMYAVSLLSRYMNCANEIHFQAAKRILRYVKGTFDYGRKFSKVENFSLHGYSDSDWAGCVNDMRSTSSNCFSFDSGIFSWSSKKQEIVAQSTAEAEYVAATAAANQALWIRNFLTDLHME